MRAASLPSNGTTKVSTSSIVTPLLTCPVTNFWVAPNSKVIFCSYSVVSAWCFCGERSLRRHSMLVNGFGYLVLLGLFAQATRTPNSTVRMSLSGAGVVCIMDMRPPAKSPKPNLIFWNIHVPRDDRDQHLCTVQ